MEYKLKVVERLEKWDCYMTNSAEININEANLRGVNFEKACLIRVMEELLQAPRKVNLTQAYYFLLL
jgi:uncharacterized protein YjbI with pentapeptide repeats